MGARRPWQSAIVRPLVRAINPLLGSVDSWQPDMVFYPALSYLALWHRRPTAVAVHDLMHLYEKEFPEACAWREVRGREVQHAQVAARASRILVDSELGGEMYLESYRRFGAHRAQVRVVPYAAPKEFVRCPDAPHRLSHLGLPNRYLLYPAQFWLHKNHGRLLSALRLALREVPDMHLVLVGSARNGWEPVRDMIASPELQGAVTHLGFVSTQELILLYSAAHGLIYPSLFGPTNVPPLEAIACGCPPAVADVYAARDQLGEMATFFDGRSVDSMADCMMRLWSDDQLRSRLVQNGESYMASKPIERFGEGLVSALL
jgi:glycosyltransferase involved in cell wall biosynthesis